MKRVSALLFTCILAFSIIGCSHIETTVFDKIRQSSAARLELPDGSSVIVDSEIASLHTFADLDLHAAPLEPADKESDWLYRMVFNPSEKSSDDEIEVSFYRQYLQIDVEYYLTSENVEFDSVLEWAGSKFAYFME